MLVQITRALCRLMLTAMFQLQEQLAPLAQKQKSIEMEKSRARALNKEEDDRISSILNTFILAMKELRVLDTNVETYLSSTAECELVSAKLQGAECNKKIQDKQNQINSIKPELDSLLKAIEDQESHKKNLKENIDVINANNAINALSKHILHLEEKATGICGHDTLFQDIARLRSQRESIIKSTARLEGRKGEILESIRSAKVGNPRETLHDIVFKYCFSKLFSAKTSISRV